MTPTCLKCGGKIERDAKPSAVYSVHIECLLGGDQ